MSETPFGSDLQAKNAIITGANQGLGRAISEAFVRAGANVVLAARTKDLLLATQRGLESHKARVDQIVETHVCDVADNDQCLALMAHTNDRLGQVSILVNNAGVYGPMGPLESVNLDEWVSALQINLLGTVHMCRAVIPQMRATRYGKIINLSGGGATAPLPRISAYAASKAAVVRLTETLAEELADAHVDVNAIAPGALNTRLLDEVLAAGPERVGRVFYERSLKQLQEGGAPLEKGAQLAVFLASSASDGITGRLISAVWDDWGRLGERRQALARSDVYTLRRIVPKDRGMDWE